MIVTDIIAEAIAQLKASGIDNPPLDARLLIGHVLGLDRAQLLSESQRLISEKEHDKIRSLLARRCRRESVGRIFGSREFWGLPLGLNEATLEPRPDSEVLIETLLTMGQKKARILDLGTGTGCLLLALIHDLSDATGLGIDICSRAIEQARHNAQTLGLAERARFQTGNWLEDLKETFDIIICNPPYIPTSDISVLMPEVRDYDPRLALDGGDDGLSVYRLLIPQLKSFLKPEGIVALEGGRGQADDIADLLQTYGYQNITKHKDLGNIDRCLTASRQKNENITYLDN